MRNLVRAFVHHHHHHHRRCRSVLISSGSLRKQPAGLWLLVVGLLENSFWFDGCVSAERERAPGVSSGPAG